MDQQKMDALSWDDPYPRLSSSVCCEKRRMDPEGIHVVGVLYGEGVGPEVVPVTLDLLSVLQKYTSRKFDIRVGGAIGNQAKALYGQSLSSEVIEFVSGVFDAKGALLCGPGGERFVYELRRQFDLFCKFTPLEPMPELRQAGVLRPEVAAAANIVAVRENLGGIYQGDWSTDYDENGRTVATHRFKYTEEMVYRILNVALKLAADRRKRLHVILKPGGIPSISQLWRTCIERVAATDREVEVFEQEIDNAVYQIIADPHQFDVIVSPNMFGDVLADCGSLLLASRGLSYSGNFNARGDAAYQTGHGAAHDIAGKDIVNPMGQILSLGMMLRESFDWPEADFVLRKALRATLREGLTTRDIAMPECQIMGTRAFALEIKRNLVSLLAGRTI